MKNWKLWAAYILFGVLMLGVISEKVLRAEWTLRYGKEFRCKVEGCDPPDFLRGRYVRFQSVPAMKWGNISGAKVVYARLETGPDGMMKFGKLMQEDPLTGDYLKHRREGVWLPFCLPFTAFYVNERRAKAVEKALVNHRHGILTFRVWKGFAVPVELEIGGVSVKEIR